VSWTAVWAIWAAVTLGSFLVLETIALVDRRRGDTLSERTRALLGIYPVRSARRVAVPVFAAVLLIFVGWFVPHIIWGWWSL
jgi:hypothetical protein